LIKANIIKLLKPIPIKQRKEIISLIDEYAELRGEYQAWEASQGEYLYQSGQNLVRGGDRDG